MLNSKALEAGIAAVRDSGGLITEETARQFAGAYLAASMPEDVKGLVDRLCFTDAHDLDPYQFHDLFEEAATTLASLSAQVEELTRDNIVAPAECSANCDDPHCHYSHHPLTLRQAYDNACERLRNGDGNQAPEIIAAVCAAIALILALFRSIGEDNG